jgi:hypothetical protein
MGTTVSKQIYLSTYSGSIFDQGAANSCVANAICQAVRIQTKSYHQDSGELARNQIYYDYRFKHSDVTKDSGASLSKMLEVAKISGIATQASAAPYSDVLSDIATAPTAAARASASDNLLTSYTSLSKWMLNYYGTDTPIEYTWPTGLNKAHQQASINAAIDEQLMHGKAVLIAGGVPTWIGNVDGKSLATQHQYASDLTQIGNHAMIIVGRDETINGGSYIVANSWGSDEGDRGYIAMSFNFLTKGFNLFDFATIDGFDGKNSTLTQDHKDVSKLYVSLLGRAADHDGLQWWADRDGVSLSQIANAFATSSEAVSKYGTLSNTAYVDQIYKNMTGHGATATTNQFYVNKLASGVSRGEVGLEMLNAILASTGDDRDTLINRNTVSETMAETYQLNAPLNEAIWAIDATTSNADSVQVTLTGIQQHLGWMSAGASTYTFG